MKICPNCKRSLDDDSAYCGYCDTKLPYVPEVEEERGVGAGTKNNAAAPALRRCENCGEQLEDNFDTCWKCGAVRTSEAGSPAACGEGDTAAPLLSVCGLDKRLEVYPDKVFIALSGAPGACGQAAYVAPCEIPIGDIVYIEFTGTDEAIIGKLVVNYTVPPPDDTADAEKRSESVLFEAGAEQEMAKVPELIKRCSMELDALVSLDRSRSGEDNAENQTASNDPGEEEDISKDDPCLPDYPRTDNVREGGSGDAGGVGRGLLAAVWGVLLIGFCTAGIMTLDRSLKTRHKNYSVAGIWLSNSSYSVNGFAAEGDCRFELFQKKSAVSGSALCRTKWAYRAAPGPAERTDFEGEIKGDHFYLSGSGGKGEGKISEDGKSIDMEFYASVHAGLNKNGKWVPAHIETLRYTLKKE